MLQQRPGGEALGTEPQALGDATAPACGSSACLPHRPNRMGCAHRAGTVEGDGVVAVSMARRSTL
ncbi:MAG: hypothetical protein KatS3mg111_3518 [Pirellulaceae bacterium]|nr:MAG: hypothetical protein KatS3mg111_3518 [Pirellulaceae bacterium]